MVERASLGAGLVQSEALAARAPLRHRTADPFEVPAWRRQWVQQIALRHTEGEEICLADSRPLTSGSETSPIGRAFRNRMIQIGLPSHISRPEVPVRGPLPPRGAL